ncbi:MAG: hypothetical protein J0L61_04020, partial [Planctomycetes bacterium]|nr:hypothetical protein [Planctomycetota bacterium]
GSFSRLPGSLQKNREYYSNSTLKVGDGAAVSVSSTKAHPTGYQAVGIGAIGALSTFAFVAVLLLRPKPPAVVPIASAAPVSVTPPPAPSPEPLNP